MLGYWIPNVQLMASWCLASAEPIKFSYERQRMTAEDNGTEDEALMLKTYCGCSQLNALRRLACISVCNISCTTCCVSLLVILDFISCCVSVLAKVGTSERHLWYLILWSSTLVKTGMVLLEPVA